MSDVVIVGAGPAGSVAALVLARAGVRVTLIDRASFPRDKLCGDTINPGALAILGRLGCRAAVEQAALTVAGMTVTGPGGASVTAAYPDGIRGAALRRRDLDVLLLDAAVSAGALFEQRRAAQAPIVENGAVVGVRTAGGELRARVVIDAEGRHPRLAFALGLARHARTPRRWAFGACFEGVTGLGDTGEMHVRADGYLGIAPLPGGLANVCLVTSKVRVEPDTGDEDATYSDVVASRFSRTSASSDPSRASRDPLLRAIGRDPMVRSRFAAARQVSPTSSLGPLAVDASAAGCAGLLLAGDAAGFVDPMTGDGLRFAFRGGELAAAAAMRELEAGESAAAWLARARAREFRGKWRLNRALRALVSSPAALAASATVSSVWPAPVRLLVALAGDVPLAADAPGLSHARTLAPPHPRTFAR